MFKKVLISVAAAGLLSACADVWNYEEVGAMSNMGSAFDAALQEQYVALAASERNEGDWDDTAYFTQKAKAAALGNTPEPTGMEERDLGGYYSELDGARADLVAVLSAGAGNRNPEMAAQAQTSFDCWAQEAEENRQPDDIENCKQNFLMAMKALGGSHDFVVYFNLDSSTLDGEAITTLDDVSQAFLTGAPARVVVVGHTDTSGSLNYNILLSQRRAESVARALAQRGIASEVMTLEAYGEERLAVPTGDGVVERGNRRVEIMFEG